MKTKSIKLIIVIILGAINSVNCQIFKNTFPPPPPPPSKSGQIESTETSNQNLVLLDSLFEDWSTKAIVLKDEKDVSWTKRFENQGYAKIESAEKCYFLLTTRYNYEKGSVKSCDLIVNVLSENGDSIASSKLSSSVGFTTISVTTDSTFLYALYQKSINAGDRDLYITKFDNRAKVVWTTKIGKRFGTSGLGLIRVHPKYGVVALTTRHPDVIFEILGYNGQKLDRKQLSFIHEFRPKSFIITKNENIVVIGTQREYIKGKTISSAIIFELDQQFAPLKYKEFKSPFVELGLDVIQNEKGSFVFLVNSEKTKGPYKQRFRYSSIGLLNRDFTLDRIKYIENMLSGINLRLTLDSSNNIYLYQIGRPYNIHQLNADLDLENTYTPKFRLGDPSFIEFDSNNNLILGGGGSSLSWLKSIDLNKR